MIPPKSKFPYSAGRQGFTLIELLVVVSIIAILAALLMTVVSSSRKSADLVESVNRQRTLGGYFTQYAADNQNTFPNAVGTGSFAGGRWPFYLATYMPPFKTTWAAGGYVNGIVGDWTEFRKQEVFHDVVGFDPKLDPSIGIWGYNLALCDGDPVPLTRVTDPGTFPVLANSQPDVSGFHLAYGGPSPLAKQRGWTGPTNVRGPAPLRGTKSLFLFADWHVEQVEVCDPKAWPWNDTAAFSVR